MDTHSQLTELFGKITLSDDSGLRGDVTNPDDGKNSCAKNEEPTVVTSESRRRRRRRKIRISHPLIKAADNAPNLPPEVEEGNVEYKRQLVNPRKKRLEQLTTQMKWRLQEGRGEALYQIGVEDNGLFVGLSEEDMELSLETLRRMAEKLGADIAVLREHALDHSAGDDSPRKAAEVLVRKVPDRDDQRFPDLRVALLGNAGVGKSTLLGVLTQGEPDNGRGQARLNLLRHPHEIQSGHTSCVSFEILGFDGRGEVVNYGGARTAERICEGASKVVTFVDLAGHRKYLNTTIFGLTSTRPDYAMLLVAANTGMAGTGQEHLGLALALKVPVFAVVTKTDLCAAQDAVERAVRQLVRLLKQPGCDRTPVLVGGGGGSAHDAAEAARRFARSHGAVVPVFAASSVSGEGLDLLKVFLNVLPPLGDGEELAKRPAEFQVDEIFTVPGVGTVVGGVLSAGVCREGDRLLAGPAVAAGTDTRFHKVTVRRIQRNRLPCRVLRAGQAASLSLGDFDRSLLRKGTVLVSPETETDPAVCRAFEAEVALLFHAAASTFRRGFEVTALIGNVKQTATVAEIRGADELRTGERAVVRFRFLKRPEYLKVGAKLVFRAGVTKGVGHVTKLLPSKEGVT